MEISNWIKNEARVIIEKLENSESPQSLSKFEDWLECAQAVKKELFTKITREKRQELIDFISNRYHLPLALDDSEIEIAGSTIVLREYFPTRFAGNMALMDLEDMPAEHFREKIGEILSAMPEYVRDFKNISAAY